MRGALIVASNMYMYVNLQACDNFIQVYPVHVWEQSLCIGQMFWELFCTCNDIWACNTRSNSNDPATSKYQHGKLQNF